MARPGPARPVPVQGYAATPVRIVSASVARPAHEIPQREAVEQLVELVGDRRRVNAIARGSGIKRRALAIPAERVAALGGTGERNEVYRRLAPGLAVEAARGAMAGAPAPAIGCLSTSSCTGCMLPGWAIDLVECLELPLDIVRTPVTEAGCAGGVVAIARAADYLATRSGTMSLAVGAELCSLAFHADPGDAALTAALLFGDGAGAALLATGPGAGLTIIDSASALVPGTRQLLGFDLTDQGFYPVLRRELADCLAPAAMAAAGKLLGRNGLGPADIDAWLIHPGGARILRALEECGGIPNARLRWSWQSMEECGNMSSAAIFDVLRRYLGEQQAASGYAVVAAFGPGVSIELLLVRREC